MSEPHTGIVDYVSGANTPDSNRPAQKVVVNVPESDVPPEGAEPKLTPYQPQVAFFIPLGPAPAAGETISWGAHHAQWAGQRVDKLTWEMAP